MSLTNSKLIGSFCKFGICHTSYILLSVNNIVFVTVMYLFVCIWSGDSNARC